jgi:hypothetical protein
MKKVLTKLFFMIMLAFLINSSVQASYLSISDAYVGTSYNDMRYLLYNYLSISKADIDVVEERYLVLADKRKSHLRAYPSKSIEYLKEYENTIVDLQQKFADLPDMVELLSAFIRSAYSVEPSIRADIQSSAFKVSLIDNLKERFRRAILLPPEDQGRYWHFEHKIRNQIVKEMEDFELRYRYVFMLNHPNDQWYNMDGYFWSQSYNELLKHITKVPQVFQDRDSWYVNKNKTAIHIPLKLSINTSCKHNIAPAIQALMRFEVQSDRRILIANKNLFNAKKIENIELAKALLQQNQIQVVCRRTGDVHGTETHWDRRKKKLFVKYFSSKSGSCGDPNSCGGTSQYVNWDIQIK